MLAITEVARIKMLLIDIYKLPILWSLGAIVLILATSVIASMALTRSNTRA